LNELKTFITETAREVGFQKVGFAASDDLVEEGQALKAWLAGGRHGTMMWLANRQDERVSPRHYYPSVKTIVSLAMNYYTPPAFSVERRAWSVEREEATTPKWSNYAWGDDYHQLIKKRLKTLLRHIKAAYPDVGGIACVDTSPVMEKVWARRAGLGWQGKHTNLITRDYGSWVFLGELLLDAALEPEPPFEQDLCGSCTACLEACPTGALTDAYRIDARRCISYLTIEYRESFLPDQPNLEGWLYGCDICQEVCPWNRKYAQVATEDAFRAREFITSFTADDWASMDRETWDGLLRGSAARRSGYDGLMRNVMAQVRSPRASRSLGTPSR